ncbi:hypothetical protein AMECASPLE_002740, partial [Ameca splendens]
AHTGHPALSLLQRNVGRLFRGPAGCEDDCLPALSRPAEFVHTVEVFQLKTIGLHSTVLLHFMILPQKQQV